MMPSMRPPRPRDTNQLAKRVVDVAAGIESGEPPPKGKQIQRVGTSGEHDPRAAPGNW